MLQAISDAGPWAHGVEEEKEGTPAEAQSTTDRAPRDVPTSYTHLQPTLEDPVKVSFSYAALYTEPSSEGNAPRATFTCSVALKGFNGPVLEHHEPIASPTEIVDSGAVPDDHRVYPGDLVNMFVGNLVTSFCPMFTKTHGPRATQSTGVRSTPKVDDFTFHCCKSGANVDAQAGTQNRRKVNNCPCFVSVDVVAITPKGVTGALVWEPGKAWPKGDKVSPCLAACLPARPCNPCLSASLPPCLPDEATCLPACQRASLTVPSTADPLRHLPTH